MEVETLRIIIPIATFVLGGALTLLIKAFEQRRDTKRRSVSSVQQLTNEWYNQLHEIFKQQRNPEFIDICTKYLSNRIILPTLLTHLEVLKGFKDTNSCVIEVELFLDKVTNYSNKTSIFDQVGCESKFSDLYNDEPNDKFLSELDLIIQRIAIQSGRLLR